MSIFVLLFSFLLQGILSLYFPFATNRFSFFSYNFIVTSLVIIYPIFSKKKKITLYYVICMVYGLFFDLVYTNTLMIDSLLFLLVGILVKNLYSKFSDTTLNLFLIVCISNTLYDIFFYLLLVLFKNIQFYPLDLVYKIIGSIFINLLYSVLFYKIVSRYKEKIKPSIYA